MFITYSSILEAASAVLIIQIEIIVITIRYDSMKKTRRA